MRAERKALSTTGTRQERACTIIENDDDGFQSPDERHSGPRLPVHHLGDSTEDSSSVEVRAVAWEKQKDLASCNSGSEHFRLGGRARPKGEIRKHDCFEETANDV